MNRETFFLYRYAYSEKQAKQRMVAAVADKHGVRPVVVYQYLKEHPDCYKISIETEFKEIEENG